MAVNSASNDPLVYDQWDKRIRANDDEALRNLRFAPDGCGIFSLCNAVHALNGRGLRWRTWTKKGTGRKPHVQHRAEKGRDRDLHQIRP